MDLETAKKGVGKYNQYLKEKGSVPE
jgi:hypothetical protein